MEGQPTPIKGVGYFSKHSNDKDHSRNSDLAKLSRQSARLIHDLAGPLSAAILQIENYEHLTGSAIIDAKKSLRLMQRYLESFRMQQQGHDQRIAFSVDTHTNQVIQTLRPIATKNDVNLVCGRIPVSKLYGNPIKFQRIISNLIINGIESYINCEYKKNKTVRIHITLTSNRILFVVSDHGGGISPEHMPRLFEQYYSTKGTNGSSQGLGLNLVKHFVEDEFLGEIKVSSSAKHGTEFVLSLPLNQPTSS